VTDVEWHEQHTSRDWRERAACRAGVDPDLFFPAAESGAARGAQVRAAKAVCARCLVRSECLAEALVRIPYGIAGGLTEHERRRLRTTRRPPHGQRGDGLNTAAREALSDGPRRGMCGQERARVGRALLAAGATPRQVATACGVTERSAARWAAHARPDTSTDTAASSDDHADAGVARGAAAATGLPSGPPSTPHTQAGTRAPEGPERR
jgi:hypothetical protein